MGRRRTDRSAGVGFSREDIHPREAARAVLMPLIPDRVPEWRDVRPGDTVRMYEGSRICGHGIVVWAEPTTWSMCDDEQQRLAQWLEPRQAGNH